MPEKEKVGIPERVITIIISLIEDCC